MRTNIVMDEQLVNEALTLTGIKTKRELVHQALLAMVKQHKRMDLRALKGSDGIDPNYDYKAARSGRMEAEI